MGHLDWLLPKDELRYTEWQSLYVRQNVITTVTRQKIVCALCMKSCYSITTNPPKKDIFYAIEVKTDLREAFAPIVEEIIMKRKVASRM